MQIEFSNPWSPHTSCKHNAMIMPEKIKHGVSSYKQFHINVCRMYHQASMLSEIAMLDDTGIRPQIMECIQSVNRLVLIYVTAGNKIRNLLCIHATWRLVNILTSMD